MREQVSAQLHADQRLIIANTSYCSALIVSLLAKTFAQTTRPHCDVVASITPPSSLF